MSLATLFASFAATARRRPVVTTRPAQVEPLESRRLLTIGVWGSAPVNRAVTEGSGSIQVYVHAHNPAHDRSTMMVQFAVSGSATPGADFAGSTSGTVEITFPEMYPGGGPHVSGSGTISLPVFADDVIEPDETAVITLVPTSDYTLTYPDGSPVVEEQKVFEFELQQAALSMPAPMAAGPGVWDEGTSTLTLTRPPNQNDPADWEILTVSVVSGTEIQTNATIGGSITESPAGSTSGPGFNWDNNPDGSRDLTILAGWAVSPGLYKFTITADNGLTRVINIIVQ